MTAARSRVLWLCSTFPARSSEGAPRVVLRSAALALHGHFLAATAAAAFAAAATGGCGGGVCETHCV